MKINRDRWGEKTIVAHFKALSKHLPATTEENRGEYEGLTKSFRTGRVERELQMVQLSAITCSCIAIL